MATGTILVINTELCNCHGLPICGHVWSCVRYIRSWL